MLILGGTAEARDLAQQVVADGRRVLSSLAGRVSRPRLPEGETRIGGFGGVAGLRAFVEERRIEAVVDATHPFAATISANAAEACTAAGVPLLRLARPGWAEHPDAASWSWVDSLDEARLVAEERGDRPFLTTGRQSLPAFTDWRDRSVLVRLVEDPTEPLPPSWTLIRSRGPYTVEGEVRLITTHRADVVVSKDSGGNYTRAKLDAARTCGVPVVIVRRPASPPAVSTVDSVAATLAWLQDL